MIQRTVITALLKTKLQEKARIPTPIGDDAKANSYELGHSLGYTDALRDVLKMLENIESTPKPW